MQCNSTKFTTETLLNFQIFIERLPCVQASAACKKFKQSELRMRRHQPVLTNQGGTPKATHGPPMTTGGNKVTLFKIFPSDGWLLVFYVWSPVEKI